MTPDERLWLAEHPCQPVVPRNVDNQIDSDDSLNTSEAYSNANLDDTSDTHMSASSANFPSGAMFPPPDSTLAKLKMGITTWQPPQRSEEAPPKL
ncbi:hypothetical protein MJO28_015629 [Puccinia striiformis f. sp. tritici]|uniref:Uncharacterized protein n=2 Tax=Puccinia striiformis f. sp. tritici TaxID=168172 RepID=A0A0L0VNV7_9BASI|nr:hypothetical protein MJO28_015629 [Puccinia striiformis f. sp. tritici]KNF00946.1 hypothetical protein PSTG_05841 [Puccinia striiformis f. sp. tritici PST-78]